MQIIKDQFSFKQEKKERDLSGGGPTGGTQAGELLPSITYKWVETTLGDYLKVSDSYKVTFSIDNSLIKAFNSYDSARLTLTATPETSAFLKDVFNTKYHIFKDKLMIDLSSSNNSFDLRSNNSSSSHQIDFFKDGDNAPFILLQNADESKICKIVGLTDSSNCKIVPINRFSSVSASIIKNKSAPHGIELSLVSSAEGLKLNLDETLKNDTLFLPNGEEFAFNELFYYVKNGKKKYVKKSNLYVKPNGELFTVLENVEYPVKRTQFFSDGTKVYTELTTVDGIDTVENRSNELKQIESQLKTYADFSSQLSVFYKDAETNEYVAEPSTYDVTKTSDYNYLISAVKSGKFLGTKTELMQLNNVVRQKKSLDSKYVEESGKEIIPDCDSINEGSQNYVFYNELSIRQAMVDINRKLEWLQENYNIASASVANQWAALDFNNVYSNIANNNIYDIKESSTMKDCLPQKISGREVRDLLYTRNLYAIALQNLKTEKEETRAELEKQEQYLLSLTLIYKDKLTEMYKESYSLMQTLSTIPVSFVLTKDKIKGYNKQGQLALIIINSNSYVSINRDTNGKIMSLTNEKGQTLLLKYDEQNKLISVSDILGRDVKISYSEDETITLKYHDGHTLSIGQETSLVEEKTVKRVTSVSENGINVTISYSSLGGIYTILRSSQNCNLDSYTITLSNNTLTITDYEKSVQKCSLCNGTFVDEELLLLGDVVVDAKQYYERLSENHPRGKITETHHANRTSLYKSASEITFDGATTVDEYDDFNRLVKKTYSNENKTITTEYEYNEFNKLAKEVSSLSLPSIDSPIITETIYCYDSAERLVQTVTYVVGEETTNGKLVEEWLYDEQGNLTKNFTYNTLDSSSKFYKTESEFDQNGKHAGDKDQTGEHVSKVEYVDGSNLVKTIETPDGSKFSYGYDLADNVTAITQSTADGEENSTQRIYENGLLTKLVSGNVVVEYTYNQKRQVVGVIVNGVTQKAYVYSEDNKTVTETDVDDNTLKTEKDDFGNVVSVVKNDTEIERNVYENGLLKTKVKDGVTRTYTYDNQDQVVSVSYSDGTPTDTFTYDDFGNVTQKTEHGKTSQYVYTDDSVHKLVSATVDGIEFTPKTDVNGRTVETQIKKANNLIEKTQIAYLKKGDHATTLPQTVRYWDKALNGYKDSLSYAYDSKGNVTQINQNGKLFARYTYDGLNRLIREDNVALNKTYLFEYDRTGNITAKRACSFTFEKTEQISAFTSEDIFTYDKDLLVAKNDLVCEYVNGRPTKYMGDTITFAEKGLISQFRGVTFSYDSFGRRTSRDSVTFTYDKNGRLISQSNGITFIYDQAGNKIGFTYGGETYYYRKNIQGDVIALYTQSGLVATYVYDAWGNHKIFGANGVEIVDNEHIARLNPIRYRGYYYDEVTSLYYLNTRYYDADVGRFISPDSVDYLSADKINGLNLYAYCSNNPVNNYDPTGNFSLPSWAKWLIGGFAFAGAIALTIVSGGSLAPVFIGMGISITSSALIGGATSAYNGEGFWSGLTTGAADGAMWGGIFALASSTVSFVKNLGLIRSRGVVIGKGMDRVGFVADQAALSKYSPMKGYNLIRGSGKSSWRVNLADKLSVAHNKAWINRVMRLKKPIYDIGLGGIREAGAWYGMELLEVANYFNYFLF